MQNSRCSRILLFLVLIVFVGSKMCFAGPSVANYAVPRRDVALVQPSDLSVYFTPNDNPAEVIEHDLNAAKRSIVLQTSTIQSLPIAKSLLAALARGVKVEIFLPEYDDQVRYFNQLREKKRNLAPPNLNVRVLDGFVGLRGTVCVIDETIVLAGSYEIRPKDSSSVATSLIRVEKSPNVAQIYLGHCRQLQEHSHLAPLCRKYALLPNNEQKQLVQSYLSAVSGLTTGNTPYQEATPYHISDSQVPLPPPLDGFNKLPWPTGVDPSLSNGRGIGIIWVVDDLGATKDVKISGSSGNSEIDNLALKQVQQHHFARFHDHGKAVPLTMSRLFRLDELFILPKHPED